MRVLIGCEESGKTRDAFSELGHDAWSCDLLETRAAGNHLKMDIVDAIIKHGPWDIIILHPDCTCLTVAGNGTYGEGKDKHFLRLAAIEWTVGLWNLAKTHALKGAAFEQPINVLPHKRTGNPKYIHPWQFGHPEQKKTCIYTHNLPDLQETDNVYDYMMTLTPAERERVFRMAPGPNRARDRSETYNGWSQAMAHQWGGLNG